MSKKEKLKKIASQIGTCKRCELSQGRKFPVLGEGNPDACVMLVGLGPGYQENLQGRPFVGAAGKFLNELLWLAGLSREEVYITNVVKCWLPTNQPTQAQLNACSPYLERQIEIISPKLLIPMGNFAVERIFEKFSLTPDWIGRVHGKLFRVSNLLGLQIVPMYHPASALYKPPLREVLRDDWIKFGALLREK